MTFKDITTVNKELQLAIREWRNHINIRKNMYTDSIISEQQHQVWINSLLADKSTKVYIAYKKDDAIGVVSINNINKLHKKADWAFYLNPDFLSSKGLGTLVEYHFLNYIFNNFEVEKLNCEVLETNPSVIKLHKKFGFTEEGIRRKNVIKDNKRIDVYLLGILKEEWYQTRGKFTKIIERLEK
jgi:UDP-4-amino-4,6-dideoxy-N-acetyl-beta-L-altrosamine N-acetyltransferase